MYHVRIKGSYTFTHKVSKIEKKHITRLARKQPIIKFIITKKKMGMYYHKDPERIIDFVKDVVEYISPKRNVWNNWSRKWNEEENPEGLQGCIQWEHPENANLKEYIYVHNSWYVYLKIERVPRLITTQNTIAGTANAFVDGRTVTVFTRSPQDYVAEQILKSVDGEQQRLNRSLFQMIRNAFPPGVDGIIYDYAMELDFGGLIKKLR